MLGGFIMNLTLKQLFKFGAVCTCACALSATAATNYVADSFEVADGASLNMPISEYKAVEYSVGLDTFTNYAWYAEAGDASSIVSNDAAYADIEGDGPISNTTAELVLNLETEGNTLSRTAGVSIADAPVYIDTLIQFTPSEDDPSIDMTDVKVALYVNAASNLVVRHKMFGASVETNSVLAGTIDPDQWYRLTMEVKNLDGFGTYATKIRLDGTTVTHANAYVEPFDAVTLGGEWFLNYQVGSGNDAINKISFQGTGLLDELVLTDTLPDFTSPVIEITLVAQGGAVTFDPVGPVGSGDTVTMTATDDWKVIASIAGPVDEAGMVQAESITTTLTAVASCTVTAVVDYATGNFPIGGGSYPVSSVGPWAVANGLGEGDVTAAMEDDYLLNVAPATDATITIVATAHAGTTITVTVGSSDPAVDFQDLNGILKLYSRASLTSGDWAEVGSAVVGGGSAEVDIVFTAVNPTDFFKAVIE
jgi:hypothetical protein